MNRWSLFYCLVFSKEDCAHTFIEFLLAPPSGVKRYASVSFKARSILVGPLPYVTLSINLRTSKLLIWGPDRALNAKLTFAVSSKDITPMRVPTSDTGNWSAMDLTNSRVTVHCSLVVVGEDPIRNAMSTG